VGGDRAHDLHDGLEVAEAGCAVDGAKGALDVVLIEVLADGTTEMTDLVSRADDKIVLRRICALPVGPSWGTSPRRDPDRRRGTHAMTPFAGGGANPAMLDAMELAFAR
jgi:hypothetical protein